MISKFFLKNKKPEFFKKNCFLLKICIKIPINIPTKIGKELKKPKNLINNIDNPIAIKISSSITSKPKDINEIFSAIKNNPKSTRTSGEPFNQNRKRYLIPSKEKELKFGFNKNSKNVFLYIDVKKGNTIIGAM